MAVLKIREAFPAEGGDAAEVAGVVCLNDGPEYAIKIWNLFSIEKEERLEWYFEKHLTPPSLVASKYGEPRKVLRAMARHCSIRYSPTAASMRFTFGHATGSVNCASSSGQRHVFRRYGRGATGPLCRPESLSLSRKRVQGRRRSRRSGGPGHYVERTHLGCSHMIVAILTPNRLFGDSLASFLMSRDDTVATTAHSFAALCEVFASTRVDLALVDITQEIELDEVRSLAGQWPQTVLLALGLRTDRCSVVRCGRAGFAAYVPRDSSLEQLLRAMDDAVAGRLTCPPEVAGELLRALFRNEPCTPSPSLGEALTARECDVLRELGNGLSNKEIARQLGLSVSTIKHHVHNILEKLQVVRRAEAMRQVRNTPWLVSRVPTFEQGKSK